LKITLSTNRTMSVLGTAAVASALLTACSTGSSNSTATTSAAAGGGAASQASNCPLVGAPDPGNSAPPSGVASASGAPKLTKKSTYNVAFSQNASNNPWRLAETASFKDEATKRGWKLTVTDANNDQAKQIQDIKGLIAQKPDALFIAPITEQLGNVVKEAGAAGIPVFLVDRDVDHNVAKPGQDFVSVMTSDFIQEGKRAAWAMANATGGNAKIIELEGTTGASPAIDRKKGFDEAVKACPGMQVIVSQDGDFTRVKGRAVAQTLLQSHPDANAIYAHNDEMAVGAIAAIKAAGKTPGKDIKLVSIDGEKDALSAIQKGELYTSVECSPRFGAKAFDTMEQYAGGQATPVALINSDRLFNQQNAAQLFNTAF
jgi:ABC-type sugar transport system substrate-binding protein